ncbi:RagB/SusD family nutrient uptake outer membrane protein [Catalinimonas niigatensis]|uniref:RagB/SusD family nutrient uptake outer membrane protein n=1 Tax=Catalinimonas niigatensis TaxID=1397264 RepID=UPI0026653794|nr:RagB/SusD family nutrient uptake outer membrane protein [Catalinimonas niigatensis]WPP51807.1 RagB/SusD family nutrient uptake outer membrane protein [Catalinimonas niigatensis]
MKKYIHITFASVMLMFFVACDDLEYEPIDQLSNERVLNSPELLYNVTIGTYSRLREMRYVRNRQAAQEFPSDDAVWVKNSGDNRMLTYSYQHIVNSSVSTQFWQEAYQGIYSANKVIEAISDDADPQMLQLKGENLFLRALMHYDLVRMFSRPYSHGAENNLGVMIRDNTDVTALPPRSSVKETYEFLEQDLLKAAELMTENKPAIYASKEVAWALLARIYLYMEQYEKAVEYADKVINSGRYQLLDTEQFREYFTIFPENNPETIFAIKIQPTENMGKGAIGSLYHGNGGWGEMFASKTYRELLYQNPNDARTNFIDPDYLYDEEGNKIPDPTEEVGYQIRKRDGLSQYFVNKYTNEGGISMLSSPIVIRLAEMYLIKAEAYAKLPGEEAEAINMVNIIRNRAGLTEDQLFSVGDLKGYDSVLDVVLDERRLELAWEGHRSFDLYRNMRDMDRSYVQPFGWSGPKQIEYTSNSIVHLIPETEIALNPNLVQNPVE